MARGVIGTDGVITGGLGVAVIDVKTIGFVSHGTCRGSGSLRIVDGTEGRGRSDATSASTSRFPLWRARASTSW